MVSEIPKSTLEQLLVNMVGAIKAFGLYPAQHPAVQKPILHVHDGLSDLLHNRDKLSMGLVDEVLVMEGIPFYDTNISIRELQSRMEERGLNALEILTGVRAEEIAALLEILQDDALKIKDAGISEILSSRGVEHIVVKDAREVYSSAVSAVSDVACLGLGVALLVVGVVGVERGRLGRQLRHV